MAAEWYIVDINFTCDVRSSGALCSMQMLSTHIYLDDSFALWAALTKNAWRFTVTSMGWSLYRILRVGLLSAPLAASSLVDEPQVYEMAA